MNQGIDVHDIELVITEYFVFSTRWVNVIKIVIHLQSIMKLQNTCHVRGAAQEKPMNNINGLSFTTVNMETNEDMFHAEKRQIDFMSWSCY